MASHPRFNEIIVPRVEIEEEVRPYTPFPLAIQPQAEVIAEPRPNSFFATAQIGDVQETLDDFHQSRIDMWQGNQNISGMLKLLSGEIEEVREDWDLDQKMSLEAYRAQEVADCLIFMLAISTQLGITYDQAELEAKTTELLLDHPRHVSTAFWTKDHEDFYWKVFSHLQSNIIWLHENTWPQNFSDLSSEERQVWQDTMADSMSLAWTLHRVYGLSPTRAMLDKIARNMDKYPAGVGFTDPSSEELVAYRSANKKLFEDADLNAHHFATQYAGTRPADLGHPQPELVPKFSSDLPHDPNLLR